MKKTNKNGILLIGPITPPLGGEALAFKVVVDYLYNEKESVYLIDKSKYKDSVFFPLLNPLSFLWGLLRFSYKSKIIYMTSGTNKLGKIRDIIVAGFAYVFNIKVMYHMHGNAFLNLDTKSTINKLLKKSINSFQNIILLSKLFIDSQTTVLNKDKISVITNSIYPETPAFNYENKQHLKSQKNEKLTLLYMSHVLPSKGLFDILEALKKIHSDGLPFIFHFAGSYIKEDNYSIDSIKERVNSYKKELKDNFLIHGYVSSEQKWNLLKESHIFLLPTNFHSEGFPISILEAMYFGQAIITTKWRAIPDIIKESTNGYFVDYNNPDQIYKVLKKLFENQNLIYDIGYTNQLEARQKYLAEKFKKNIMQHITSFYKRY